jgi:hypothetical protein
MAGSGGLMAAAMAHRATVLRAGGQLAAGLHEFAVPVDRADSLLFSISVQCLRIVEIVRPSGEVLQASGAGVDYSHFEAGLFVTIAHPDVGLWHVRLSGSRLFLTAVQARAALSLDAPRFVPDGPPRVGVPQVVRFRVDGARDVRARLVTQGFQDLAPIALRSEPDGAGGETFAGEILPTARSFRVVVSGRDAEGLAFQRVHAPLFEPAPAR